jgi:hypothetical protein
MSLSANEIIVGIGDSLFIIVSFIIGFKILLKYAKYKKREFLLIALTWIFLSFSWLGGALSFISFLIAQKPINKTIILIFNNAFSPIALLCWLYSLILFDIFQKKNKLLLYIGAIIFIPYDIILIILCFIEPDIIGTFSGNYFLIPGLLTIPFKLLAMLITIITGIAFAKISMQSTDSRIRIKGTFLLSAFISFMIGLIEIPYVALFRVPILQLHILLMIIFRLFLISSVVLYYFGFFLPDLIADRIIKK